MKTPQILFASFLTATLAAPAFAAGAGPAEAKAPTTQQQRMKDCNAEARSKQLKGEERRTFMSACLKGKPAASAAAAPEPQASRR